MTSEVERLTLSERHYSVTCDELQTTVSDLRAKLKEVANVSVASNSDEINDLHAALATLLEEKVRKCRILKSRAIYCLKKM